MVYPDCNGCGPNTAVGVALTLYVLVPFFVEQIGITCNTFYAQLVCTCLIFLIRCIEPTTVMMIVTGTTTTECCVSPQGTSSCSTWASEPVGTLTQEHVVLVHEGLTSQDGQKSAATSENIKAIQLPCTNQTSSFAALHK